MKIGFDLQQFKRSVAEKRAQFNAATRPAAQAGAQVIYEAARARAPVGTEAHFFYGSSFKKTGQKYLFYPGSLKKSIYQVFSEDNSTDSKATYHVSWNAQKAPYAAMVEFGTSRAPAHPFMGPAIHENSNNAAAAMRARFIQEVTRK